MQRQKVLNQKETGQKKSPQNLRHTTLNQLSASAESENINQRVVEVQELAENGSDEIKVLAPAKKRKYQKGKNVNPSKWSRNLNAAKRRKGDKYSGLKKQAESVCITSVFPELVRIQGKIPDLRSFLFPRPFSRPSSLIASDSADSSLQQTRLQQQTRLEHGQKPHPPGESIGY
ncbi:hypothetical protein WA026_021410 [Henosepilachna vigintioctopunctata]|uniref:Uncharacterized protein n=1 Tax=Henosepilachna vigintioctopunctata TaxID=420089 RepID=A0AAW1TNS1_9CUCU